MPELDGFETTVKIREWEVANNITQRTLITALTAHALPEHKIRCAQAGMDGYLCKSISRKLFEEYLQENFRDSF